MEKFGHCMEKFGHCMEKFGHCMEKFEHSFELVIPVKRKVNGIKISLLCACAEQVKMTRTRKHALHRLTILARFFFHFYYNLLGFVMDYGPPVGLLQNCYHQRPPTAMAGP